MSAEFLESLYYVAEIVGVIAIIASLLGRARKSVRPGI